MLVKLFGELEKFGTIDIDVANIPQMLSGIRHTIGDEAAMVLIDFKHYYLLQKGEEFIPIHPQMIAADFSNYESVWVIPDIGGDGGLIVAGIAGAAFAGTVTGIAIATIINIAIAIALNFIMQLLSPTMSFESDPAEAQKLDSNLYSGSPMIRNQGGPVPICVGQCRSIGALISSGITAEEKTI